MSDENLSSRRQYVMQALEGQGPASYPFLETLLRDPNPTVRLNTIQVIQFIGTSEARTLLQIALKDSSPDVREAAAEALKALGYVPAP